MKTPILEIDEDAEVTERLTTNVEENILPARYLLKDDNGDVIERPTELFERVAENVAQAETEYEEGPPPELAEKRFEKAIKELRLMPNSPTLMNAGTDMNQLSACISGNTPIYTKNGLKPMANINEGDMVLTHTGSFKKVTSHWSNGVKETLDVKRGTSRGNNYSVTATPDHKFLQENESWAELQNISDAKQPTVSPDVEIPDSFDLTQYTAVMGKDKPVVSDDGVLKVKNCDDPRTGTFDKQYSEVVASVENNDTFGYIAGAYLAEGDVDGSDLRFTIGSDENEFEQRIVKGLIELFDVNVTVIESNHGNWKTITASSPFIADFFLTQFGTGSGEKQIPKWMFAANESYQQEVLTGILDGDGHDQKSSWKITLANPDLAYETSLLARNIGYQTNFTLEAENELSANPTSRVIISKKNSRTCLNNIEIRDSEKQEVYDMEVADDHSFVAGDFIVHNCFVQEPRDDMEDIFNTSKYAALVFQSGGGVGYPFHHLRPKGHIINSTGGYASGPVSFMHVFNTTCDTVEQGGKRRGAQMGILRVDHPDVGRFAVAKRDEGNLANFNISVGVTDDFIEALEKGENYTLGDPTADYDEAYEVTEAVANFYNYEYRDNPASAFGEGEGKTVDENLWRDYADSISARLNDTETTLEEKWGGEIELEEGEPLELPAEFIWDIMLDGAHRNGEPGIFYYDWSREDHSFPEENDEYGIEATNPCAEQPLSEHEACNLAHVNLSLMVDEDAPTWDEYELPDWLNQDRYDSIYNYKVEQYVYNALDMETFTNTVVDGTRFLENVVEQSDFPLEQIEEKVASMRKIGLGIMGLAQMLYQMGVPYDSDVGRDIAAEVMRRINLMSTQVSHDLAKERGVFDAWEDSKWADPMAHQEWFKRHTGGLNPEQYKDGYEIRNHNTTTIAPCGTTSMIGDTSGGCEPVYSVAYYKNVGGDIQGDDFLVEFDSYFLHTLEQNDIDVEAVKAEAEAQMEADEFDGISGLNTVPDEFGDVFVTTEQISSKDHTLMQRRLQEHVDSGISKTINLPGDADLHDVADAYERALSRDGVGKPAKGITVYRDGSRDEQVKSTTADMDEAGSSEGMEAGVPDPIELYQSDEYSDEEVEQYINEVQALVNDDETEICPECEDGVLQPQEGCSLCTNCGFSPCS